MGCSIRPRINLPTPTPTTAMSIIRTLSPTTTITFCVPHRHLPLSIPTTLLFPHPLVPLLPLSLPFTHFSTLLPLHLLPRLPPRLPPLPPPLLKLIILHPSLIPIPQVVSEPKQRPGLGRIRGKRTGAYVFPAAFTVYEGGAVAVKALFGG